ncbi:MAG TPA: VCBS repeat-containing protein [Bryobacteraceae bacterium]|nr:VCBS repeat-containing protein [Bryobacteraceae bacterium]
MLPTLLLYLAMAPSFRAQTITTALDGGYQVVAADLNRDGKPDLIALASGSSELVWFENPGWQRHVIAGGRTQMINLAAADLDGDGIPELLLAEGFAMDPRKSAGVLSLLKHRGDPREPWSVKEIDRLPAAHRVRWIEDARLFVVAPLAGASAAPPGYRAHVPLVAYRPSAWKREIVSDVLEGVLHGIAVADWNGDGREDILSASFSGIHWFERGGNGAWRGAQLAKGDPDAWPKSGASEVAMGRLGKRKFFCTIEPWHGNVVAVYFEDSGVWQRRVIEEKMEDGHALLTVDLDGDGRDEIVAGFRGKGESVWIYSAGDAAGSAWSRTALDDGGMAAASCAAADLNGDGRADLACIDNHRLKWYTTAL